MDQNDILKIVGMTKSRSVTYDPITQTYIFGGQGLLIKPPEGPCKSIPPCSETKPKPAQEQKIREGIHVKDYCPPDCLRFVPNQKSGLLLLSPSGKLNIEFE